MVKSAALPVALVVMALCQTGKLIGRSIIRRRFAPEILFSPGGMPSGHSSFVTALAVGIGFDAGFDSALFALASVFAAIVMYDAIRLRGAVEKTTRKLNALIREIRPEAGADLPEHVGHNLAEVAVGALLGLVITVLAYRYGVGQSLISLISR